MLSQLPASKWNYNAAAHLLNRAGFGGTPAEIQKLADLGLEKAVSNLVDFDKIEDPTPNPEWAKPDPTRFKRGREFQNATPEQRREMQREEQRKQRERLMELRQWWLERMTRGPRPLQEKLTLFWHGHFATSAQKVKDSYLMWRQNDIFRRNAAGNWLTLLTEAGKDPAMLVWLDQAQSKKDHPNENFAREVMELFALGEGHYTEQDVTEAARALTGWSFDRVNQAFINRPFAHDQGNKQILGQRGSFRGDDVLRIIVEQPQASRFITAKLWSFFAAENPPAPLVDELASEFSKNGREFKPVLRRMFASEEFYSEKVVRQQVKSPVQWLVGSVRMLERELPPQTIAANTLRMLGQDLFMPPNVKGWDGGVSWITTNNLLSRYNFAAYLVMGENPFAGPMARGKDGAKPRLNARQLQRAMARAKHVDVQKLLPQEDRSSQDKLLEALQQRFLQSKLRDRQEKALREYLDGQKELDDHDLLHAIRLIMATPEYQLA